MVECPICKSRGWIISVVDELEHICPECEGDGWLDIKHRL